MNPPTLAPAYVGLFPVLAEAAQSVGYALAVHGSISRDFDIIAVPWVEDAQPTEDLVRAIWIAIEFRREPLIEFEMLLKPPYTEQKPHNRISFLLPLGCGASIDMSVMPTTKRDY